MASHEYLRFILKTPKGYLTETGTTEDICDENIIVLNIYGIGGAFSSKKRNVQNFLQHSTANFDVDECQVLSYECPTGGYYHCDNCPQNSSCDFWGKRTKMWYLIKGKMASKKMPSNILAFKYYNLLS